MNNGVESYMGGLDWNGSILRPPPRFKRKSELAFFRIAARPVTKPPAKALR